MISLWLVTYYVTEYRKRMARKRRFRILYRRDLSCRVMIYAAKSPGYKDRIVPRSPYADITRYWAGGSYTRSAIVFSAIWFIAFALIVCITNGIPVVVIARYFTFVATRTRITPWLKHKPRRWWAGRWTDVRETPTQNIRLFVVCNWF